VEACPYAAISINEQGVISVDIIKCRGCGTCNAICPSKAIELVYFRDDQYVALLDELIPMLE
ncbi:MAG: 4Fe-4S binding protein, partial [Promethearchaeota archaeon]